MATDSQSCTDFEEACFLCLTQINPSSPTNPSGGGGDGEQGNSSKILLQYLLVASEDVNFKGDILSSSAILLCDKCEICAKRIEELHMKLETIQKRLTEKLKHLKNVIITSNSREEDDLNNRQNELCFQFQAFIRDNCKKQVQFMISVVDEGEEEVSEDIDTPTVAIVEDEMEMEPISPDWKPEESKDPFDSTSVPLIVSRNANSSETHTESRTVSSEQQVVEVNTGRRKVTCAKCPGRIFALEKDLRKHEDVCHPRPGERFKCSRCPEEFPSKREKNRHAISHGPMFKEDFCSKCGYAFSTRSERWKHLNLTCKPQNERPSSSSKLWTRRRHQRTKTRVPCDICGYSLKNEGRLRRHKEVMHGILPTIHAPF